MFCCDESDVDLNKNESSSMKDYENARIFYTVLTQFYLELNPCIINAYGFEFLWCVDEKN